MAVKINIKAIYEEEWKTLQVERLDTFLNYMIQHKGFDKLFVGRNRHLQSDYPFEEVQELNCGNVDFHYYDDIKNYGYIVRSSDDAYISFNRNNSTRQLEVRKGFKELQEKRLKQYRFNR